MSEAGHGPFKADFGCHAVCVGADKPDNWMFWHIHDRDGQSVAFFWNEEDAVEVADLWNGVHD